MSTIKFPTLSTTKHRVKTALDIFLANDVYLLEVDANERAITHKFAEALQIVFRSWHVDCEYNRNLVDPKRITLHETVHAVVPDIVIHRRGSDKNLLAVEAKKASTVGEGQFTDDQYKLTQYCRELNYRYALLVVFYTGQQPQQPPYRLQWFSGAVVGL